MQVEGRNKVLKLALEITEATEIVKGFVRWDIQSETSL